LLHPVELSQGRELLPVGILADEDLQPVAAFN
jgi:hypothetical protein